MVTSLLKTLLVRLQCSRINELGSIDMSALDALTFAITFSSYSPKLIEVCLTIAEKALGVFGHMESIDNLMCLWTDLLGFVERSNGSPSTTMSPVGKHARREVLLSMFRVLDGKHKMIATTDIEMIPVSRVYISKRQVTPHI
jgi:hypothetical protein